MFFALLHEEGFIGIVDEVVEQGVAVHCLVRQRRTLVYVWVHAHWGCIEDASRALQGKKTYDTWQEGLQQIFEAVLENKPFILNVYRSVKREQVENYLYSLTYQLIEGVAAAAV